MDDSLIGKTAKHEAAHAVMRWLLGLPATRLELHDTGGLCHGSGKLIETRDELLVTLAGFAWEAGYLLFDVDWVGSRSDDFDHARDILRRCPHLCLGFAASKRKNRVVTQNVDVALKRWFRSAGQALLPHDDLIDVLGDELVLSRKLSARHVAAIMREHGEADLDSERRRSATEALIREYEPAPRKPT